jgi:hypothetical protein
MNRQGSGSTAQSLCLPPAFLPHWMGVASNQLQVHESFLAPLPHVPACLPACSAYQILIFLSSTAWGLLTVLCLWPPIWTMLPRQAGWLHCWVAGAWVGQGCCPLCPADGMRAALHKQLLQMRACPSALWLHCRVETEQGWRIVWDPFATLEPRTSSGLGRRHPSAASGVHLGGRSGHSGGMSSGGISLPVFNSQTQQFSTATGPADLKGQGIAEERDDEAVAELWQQTVACAVAQTPAAPAEGVSACAEVSGTSGNALSPQQQANPVVSCSLRAWRRSFCGIYALGSACPAHEQHRGVQLCWGTDWSWVLFGCHADGKPVCLHSSGTGSTPWRYRAARPHQPRSRPCGAHNPRHRPTASHHRQGPDAVHGAPRRPQRQRAPGGAVGAVQLWPLWLARAHGGSDAAVCADHLPGAPARPASMPADPKHTVRMLARFSAGQFA